MGRRTMFLVALYAGVGLAISFAVNLVSLFALPPGGMTLIFGLGFAVFPPFAVVVTLNMRAMGNRPVPLQFSVGLRRYWDAYLPDCPVWMRRSINALYVYAYIAMAVIFFLGFTGGLAQPDHTISGQQERVICWSFSAFLMLFYGVSFVSAATMYRRDPAKLAPRCTNGHAVTLSDRFCPECGVPLDRS